MTALLEGPAAGDGLDTRWHEARAKVSALEAEAAAAARDGQPVDAAALAQARAEAEALGGALALDADEDRERAARAEADRIAGHKAAARKRLAEFLDMVDEAEAQARGMVAAMMRAEACRAALQRELGVLDAKLLYDQASFHVGLADALSGALMPIVGESRRFGYVTFPATRNPSAWRVQFSWLSAQVTRHIGDEHG